MDMGSKIVSVGDTIYAAVNVDVPVAGLEFTIEVKMINQSCEFSELSVLSFFNRALSSNLYLSFRELNQPLGMRH